MSKNISAPLLRTARLLDLVPFLNTHQGIALKELAAHFDVTPAQMSADLMTLWMCGLPGYTPLELMDLAFLDFNFDGKKDVLTISNKKGYNGYGLRLYLNTVNGFVEDTKSYFDIIDGEGKNGWIKWIRLFDYDQDGDVDVVADGLFGVLEGNKGRRIYWRNDAGKFKQINL